MISVKNTNKTSAKPSRNEQDRIRENMAEGLFLQDGDVDFETYVAFWPHELSSEVFFDGCEVIGGFASIQARSASECTKPQASLQECTRLRIGLVLFN